MASVKKLLTALFLFVLFEAAAAAQEKGAAENKPYELGICLEKTDYGPEIAAYADSVYEFGPASIEKESQDKYETTSARVKIDIKARDSDLLAESGVEKILLYENGVLYAGQQFTARNTEETVFSVTMEHFGQEKYNYKAVALDKDGNSAEMEFSVFYNRDALYDFVPKIEVEVEGMKKGVIYDNKSGESVNFISLTGEAKISIYGSDPALGFKSANDGIKRMELYEIAGDNPDDRQLVAAIEPDTRGNETQELYTVLSCGTALVHEYEAKVIDHGGNAAIDTFKIEFATNEWNFNDPKPLIEISIAKPGGKPAEGWVYSTVFIGGEQANSLAAASEATEAEIVINCGDHDSPNAGVKSVKLYENDILIHSWQAEKYALQEYGARIKVSHDSGLYRYKIAAEDAGSNVSEDELLAVFGAKCE